MCGQWEEEDARAVKYIGDNKRMKGRRKGCKRKNSAIEPRLQDLKDNLQIG
jgi:hypothetical protein